MSTTVQVLIEDLKRMPQHLEVGTADGMVIGVGMSSYDDEDGQHDYVNLDIDEG